jgi:hypothetical protein
VGFDPYEAQQRALLRSALRTAGISIGDLWLHYFSIGGAVGEYEIEAYLQGLLSLPALQRDLLAMAANELIDDLPRPRAPYSDEFPAAPDLQRNQPAQDEVPEQSRSRESPDRIPPDQQDAE